MQSETAKAKMSSMTIKEQIHRLVDSLPDDADIDAVEEMHHRLYVLEKVRKGLDELDRGEGIPHDEVKQRLAEWLTD